MFSFTEVFYDLITPRELNDAYGLESTGYPPDEAATLDALRYRQSQAPQLFLGAFLPSDTGRTLIGYICSTLSPSESLTHESMSTHVASPSSSSVCIHSICVDAPRRRKGVGTGLLNAYLSHLERLNQQASEQQQYKLKRVLLITHEELRGFYEKAGFEWVGRSPVVHGSKPWFEMRKDLSDLATQSLPVSNPTSSVQLDQSHSPQIPPGLWEALQNSSSRPEPVDRLLSSFPNGLQDVVTSVDASDQLNKFDLLCPRGECGSVILKQRVGKLVERESLQLEPPSFQTSLAPLPSPPALIHWWLITPSPMAFENISVSRPVGSEQTPNLKLLACAECELGPLGWCEQGGTEFWLACERVGYRG